ncbi:ElyC/SanA/YdcF family protein [Flavobacterium coralii]|uniref:YdcF family protein n=1 Tax=Flavobacterium coralii TaxID=2838017 RepID=UPI000C39D53D|nr:hypothetical protein [Flavobacterium sp.]|tara:strand:+ start:15000 stop:15737 length:738 start_codon:yes stop_codon:yes gene_type:complete
MEKLISPIYLFWILLLLALVLNAMKRKKTARLLVIIAIAELFIFSVSPLPIWLMRNLEQQYKPLDTPQVPEGTPIIVLGGGHVNDSLLSASHRLSGIARSRLMEGVRIYNKMNRCRFITSGYAEGNKVSQAELMAQTAIALGVKADDIIMLLQPKTTWEEAMAVKKYAGTDKKIIVVTSASHMPRAIQTFKQAGLNPVAAPADYYIKHDAESMLYTWTPSAQKITYTEKAMHEYLGMLYYKWFKK